MKPVEAKNAGIEQYGTVVVNYKDKTERVSDSEQDLTNALIKAMSTMGARSTSSRVTANASRTRPSATATAR